MKTDPIESTLYKNKVKIKFFPDTHIYMVDGKRVTGVTTYLGIIDKSRPLITWATELYRDFLLAVGGSITEEHIWSGSTLHEEKKLAAASIGDEVHDWINKHIEYQLSIDGKKSM